MQAIHEALDRHDGNKPKAAEELGISLKTLYNKLNQAAAMEQDRPEQRAVAVTSARGRRARAIGGIENARSATVANATRGWR